MQKNNRLKQILAVILAFTMLLTGIVPGSIGMNNVKANEVSTVAENQNVYFLNENNEKVYMDENNTFTLTTNDKGKFVAEGVNNPYWDCNRVYATVTDPNTGNVGKKSWYWVRGNGDFNPYTEESQTTVTLYANGEYGTKKLTFTLKIIKEESPYEELKAYINNEELTTENPYVVNVADETSVTFKARKKGETEFSWISAEELEVHETDTNYGRYDRVKKKFIVLRGDKDAEFTVSLSANSDVKVTFALRAREVPMQSFHINVPSEASIGKWNTLANQYVGVSYTVSYFPSNTSDRDLVWEDETPEIAQYDNETYSNGIVPIKAGTAKFLVYSKSNPEIKQEVTIEFKYQNPLQKVSVEADTVEMKVNDRKEITINTVPENATQQLFDWTYSEDGIVSMTDRIEGDSDATKEKKAYHTLRALKAGTVIVTGTPLDDTAGCEPVQFTVKVTTDGSTANTEKIDKIVSEGIASAIRYMDKQDADPSIYEYGNSKEWRIITKYRVGQTLSKDILNRYYNSAAKEAAKWKSAEKSKKYQKPTDIAKLALTLSSFGADITDVKGVNLAEMMYNSPRLKEGSNELIWCLLALDATNIEIPENATWSRKAMVDALLSFQNQNGGYGLNSNKTYDVDLTGMAFQALAPYAKDEKVKASIDKSLEFLRGKLTQDYGYETSETCSMVILGLATLKLDPLENGFGTAENNIFTYFEKKYAFPGGGFRHKATDEEANYMGTYQALEAFEAYRRYAAGEKSFWDMSDVEKFVPDSTDADTKPGNDTKPATSNKLSTATTTQKKQQTKVSKPGRVIFKKVNRSGKKIELQWKKVKGCSGYQIWTSNKKNGKYKLVKTKKGVNTVKYTFKQKKKKKVFVKVRAYKTVGKTKVYGNYSKVKKVK